MEVIEGTGGARPVIPIAIVVGSLGILTLSVVGGLPVMVVAPVICVVIALAVTYRAALRWTSLVAFVIGVILFVPIRRYVLPFNLPFNMEPYRLVVILVALAWCVSLLVDPRVRTRPTGFRGPLLLFSFGALASIIANPTIVNSVEAHVIKQLSYFASFIIVILLIVSVIRTQEQIDLVVKVLAGCGAIIAFFSVVQARTGYNIFDHLTTFVPFLKVGLIPENRPRGGRIRAYGSTQHAIELGAMLVMLVPFAVYLARRTGQKRWFAAVALMLLGALGTFSRTSMLMGLVVVLVFLILRPKETRRLWPLLIPLLAVMHIALPGAIGTFKESFFPKGGLVHQQTQGGVGSGRVASFGPAWERFSREPLLGQGFGTRITQGEGTNSFILDDQWLSTLVETGVVGFVAWLWMFTRAVRRFGRAAKRDHGDLGWLLAAVTSSVAAFMVGMFTFDAFGFTQVTFVLFIQIAVAQAAFRLRQAAG